MEQQKAESCKEDATMPQDIEKRFQHLVNEWFSFQKRAGFLGSSKEVLFSNLVGLFAFTCFVSSLKLRFRILTGS
ncbi:hypothetical protein GOP47_0022966 [Adiantum capillus-veneris]|uniref:Uncharacterized protein n=1 Tax=Adiantum capillus-veneris TaxID=13818 RepID=A0A9D4U7H7_ADICA|nr:hypothetical protein GOP47_0022966 [Adiantum capillus-veneris]